MKPLLKIAPFATIVVVIASLSFMLSAACKKTKSVQITDFEKHPIYKNYKFSNDEKVIEIGVPTPWASGNHLVEIMKRDEILKEDLKKRGYKVVFFPFMKGDEINYFMRKGHIEGSIIGDMPTLVIAAEGRIDIISVFNKGSVSLVSRDIYRIKDLKGKKMAYPYGSIAHYYLFRILSENGMSENDIRHVPMDTGDILNAIRDKTIDAFTTFEPTATIYTKIDPTLHAIHRSFSSYAFFNMRKDYGEKNREAVKALISAQIRAMLWITASDENRSKASRWMADESAKIVQIPLGKYIKELNSISAEDISGNTDIRSIAPGPELLLQGGDISKEFEFLKTIGFIPKDRKWEDVIRHFDARTAGDVIKGMKSDLAKIPQ